MKKKIYYFTASWCAACNAFKPFFVKWANENNIAYKLLDVEADENIDLVANNKIRNLPTLLILDEQDQIIGRESGNINVKELDKYL